MGKYGEPWMVTSHPESGSFCYRLEQVDAPVVVMQFGCVDEPLASRIVAAVNALAAVPDALLPEVAAVLENVVKLATGKGVEHYFAETNLVVAGHMLAAAREVQP